MGFDKLNPWQREALTKALNEGQISGQITEEERKALYLRGINEELLNAFINEYTGGNPNYCIENKADNSIILFKEPSLPQEPEKNSSSNLLGAIFKGILLLPFALVGCSPADEYTEFGDNNINASTNLSVSINNITKDSDHEEILKAILAELQNRDDRSDILAALNRIEEKLAEIGLDTGSIKSYLLEAGVKFDILMEKFKDFDANKLMEVLVSIQEDTETTNNILTKLANNDEEVKALLEKIFNGIKEGNQLSKENNELLTKILSKIGNLDKNDKVGLNVLKEILRKITELEENEAVMDGKVQKQLQAIIERLDKLSDTQKYAVSAIVNALNGIGDKADAILQAILNGDKLTSEQLQTIIKNQEKQTAQFDELRKLVMENNKIAKGTQDAVNNLSAQNNKDHAKIIDLLTKLANKPEADMSAMDDIKAILKEIQTNTAGNWDTSLRIEDKLNIVAQTINVILQTQTDLGEGVKAHLLAILAKIPEGCNCEHKNIDLTELMKKLDELIKAVEEGRNDPKHEGILDDLENQLG